jgi:hypothetical protein
MLTKPLLLVILAVCAAPSGAAADPNPVSSPNEKAPPVEPHQQRETHWCCDSVNSKEGSGEGCDEIHVTHVVLCEKVLHCSSDYTYDDGKVTCL